MGIRTLWQSELRRILDDPRVPIERVHEFRRVLREQPERVIRNAYRKGDSGCILWHLTGVETRGARIAFFVGRSDSIVGEFVVQCWDAAQMTHDQVAMVVDVFLAERQASAASHAMPVELGITQEGAARDSLALAS